MRVTIIGELNVDLIIKGNNLKLKWNSEKLIDSCDLVLGSSSAITACALAGLGVDVTFVSMIGDDLFGHFCLAELRKRGIDTQHVIQRTDVKTGATLSFSTSEDRALLTHLGSIPLLTLSDIPQTCVEDTDHVHFGSYYLQDGMRDHWETLFKRIQSRGISTSFDTGWDVNEIWYPEQIESLLSHTSLFIPSEDELMEIFPSSTRDDLLERLSSHGCIIGLKRGSEGSLLIGQEGEVFSTNAYQIEPIDTTGAGDSFNAGLIYGYKNQWPHEKILYFANACGAMATQRIGGASMAPSVEEIEAFMNTHKVKSTN